MCIFLPPFHCSLLPCVAFEHLAEVWKLFLSPEGNIQTSGNHLELWSMRYPLKVIQVAKFGLQTILPIIKIRTISLMGYLLLYNRCASTLWGQFSPSTLYGFQTLNSVTRFAQQTYDHEYLFISVLRVFSFSGILLIHFPTFLRSLKCAVLGNNWVKMVLSDTFKDPSLSFVLKISFLLCLFSSVLKVLFCFLNTQLDVARC